jgi:hypothetical protein
MTIATIGWAGVLRGNASRMSLVYDAKALAVVGGAVTLFVALLIRFRRG